MKLDYRELRKRIGFEIERQATAAIPGPEKRAKAVDAIVEWLDEQINPRGPLGEALSDFAIHTVGGPLLRALIESLVQEQYERRKAAGAAPEIV